MQPKLLIGTKQMISKHSVNFTVSFIGKTLMAVESARDLGVYIDLHLTYDTHISHLVSSCLTKLVQINRVNYCFDRKTLVLIITSLVFSKMLYCSTVWSNTSSKNIEKLQLIQNFACKIICGARKYDHVTPLLDELNWLPVSKMLKFRDAVTAYKCASNLAPEYLCTKFKKRSSVHNRTTCNNEKFEIPLFRSATSQRTFAYRAVSLWNTLDEDLRNATSVKAFKKALKLVMNEWLYDS